MTHDAWTSVDRYLTELLIPADPALEQGLAASREAGLPEIEVSAPQGKLLMLLVRMSRAARVLEVGTLGGFSTTWLARGLPEGGRVVTLEAAPEHAAVAKANLERAGCADRVEIRVGPALDTLPALAESGEGPFDLVFIDADKVNYPGYLEWSLRLTRPGSVIVADNVVRNGRVTEAASPDENVRGVRSFLELAATDPRLDATVVQTVGGKGWDGLAVAVVTEAAPTS